MSNAQTPEDLKQWRRETRKSLLEQRLAAGGEKRKAWNTVIHAALRSLLSVDHHRIIAFYWPFKGEFACRGLMREMYEQGAQIVLPVVAARHAPLEFRLWQPDAEMERGVWDIPIPKEKNVATPDTLIIPVVGFDLQGYRLGYGGGHYDRTLASFESQPERIGVGYEISRLETIYPQDHDIPLQKVVTEAGIYDF